MTNATQPESENNPPNRRRLKASIASNPRLADELSRYDVRERNVPEWRRPARAKAKAIIEERQPWPRELLFWKAIHEASGADAPWLYEENLTRPQRERLAAEDAAWEAKMAAIRRVGAERTAIIAERNALRARRKALGKVACYIHGVAHGPLTDPLGPREDESLMAFWGRVDREHPRITDASFYRGTSELRRRDIWERLQ